MELIEENESLSWNKNLSFSKNSFNNQNFDHFLVPVTISQLNINLDEEKLNYIAGSYSFSKVQVVGIVQEIIEEDGVIQYILSDPEKPELTVTAVQYNELSPGFVDDMIFKSQRVRLCGKLKAVNNETTVLIFSMQPVSEGLEYQIFNLEAKVAKLFFEKNVIEQMRCGNLKQCHGMLAPPWSRKYIEPQPFNINTQQCEGTNSKTEVVGKPSNSKQYKGMKAKLYGFIRSQIHSGVYNDTIGVPFKLICKKMNNMVVRDLQELLDQMIDDGSIFATENDHYSLMDA